VVESLDVEVHDVRAEVGETPGDAVVVADHDARQTREAEPRDVVAAGVREPPAVQPDLVPDPRHTWSQMWVVGQQRLSTHGERPRHDPRVRPQTRTDAGAVGQRTGIEESAKATERVL